MPGMGQLRVPNWLRRSVEAAIAAGLVAVVSLVGGRLSSGSDVVVLSRTPSDILLLAPSVLALGVIPAAWPTGMAPTRTDALFGAVAGFLIAADATALLAGGRLLDDAAALDAPTMVLVGAQDCITPPEKVRRAFDALRGPAERHAYRVISHAGHALCQEQPAVVARAIAEFAERKADADA